MKLLIRRVLRLGYVVVDLPEGHRLKDRLSGRPVPTLEQERPLRAGIKLVSVGQELGPGHAGHPPLGEHNGHFLAGRLEILQRLQSRLR
jgi:hypothetical protein